MNLFPSYSHFGILHLRCMFHAHRGCLHTHQCQLHTRCQCSREHTYTGTHWPDPEGRKEGGRERERREGRRRERDKDVKVTLQLKLGTLLHQHLVMSFDIIMQWSFINSRKILLTIIPTCYSTGSECGSGCGLTVQVAPFWQGAEAHSSMSVSQFTPK